MPKAVVGLSGIYDLTLRTPPPSPQFINDVDNYTNTIEDNFIGWEIQWSASPMARVAAATNIPPVRLYRPSMPRERDAGRALPKRERNVGDNRAPTFDRSFTPKMTKPTAHPGTAQGWLLKILFHR